MKTFRWFILFFLYSILIFPAAFAQSNDFSFYEPPANVERLPRVSTETARNVILCIGDGMGFTQLAAARLAGAGANGLLHCETMPISGVVKTHSHNRLITDSAAGATAYASGKKSNNKMLRVAPDSTTVYPSIMAYCQKAGKATALIATSSITHATPAAFGAHAVSRYLENDIATQLIANRIDVLLGGGLGFFLPQSESNSFRKDALNLLEVAENSGYTVVTTRRQLLKANSTPLLGLFAKEGMTTHAPEPALYEMTRKALELVSRDPDGFFLMMEGSQIDWACHDNDANEAIRQTLLFDQAVAEALAFARSDGTTLVIVTADHETGGMTLNGGELSGENLDIRFSTDGHTAVTVPLFAYGPGSEAFTGIHDNTEIFWLIARALQLPIHGKESAK